MPRACSQCGCTDIDTDPARGDAVCTNCGTVLEDQIIVSEVQYQENAAGGASVIGQFVSNDGTRAQSFRGAYGHGFSSEDSRKLTLENGYKKLKEMGGQLRMHQSSIETAFGFFKLAVAHKFTRGRKMEYVLASCLYLVCRVDPGGSEDLELMLIDFSDLIQVNVHVLGRTFVQLATELCQNIRIVDPIIYIRRFANQLHYGDKINKVVESATRLVSRMKRDWMHTGRRPAGLCGAALLISSRMHNFNRTIDQIIKVVKVCESTVRKRLLEFESTPSAQLTIEEFDNVDLEEEQDPPCFTEGKKKAKQAQMKDEISDSMMKELNKYEANINKSLKRKSALSDGEKESITDFDKMVQAIDGETVKKAAGDDWKTGEWEGIEDGEDEIDVMNEDSLDQNSNATVENIEAPVIKDKSKQDMIGKREVEDEKGKTLMKDEVEKVKILAKDEDETVKLLTEDERGKMQTKEEDERIKILTKDEVEKGKILSKDEDERDKILTNEEDDRGKILTKIEDDKGKIQTKVEDGELDLTGIDDEELDKLIMSEEEAQHKAKWFDIEFGDYMEIVKDREEKRRVKEEAAAKKKEKNPKAKKKKKKGGYDLETELAECMEILKKREKKLSDKINYNVLNTLDAATPNESLNTPIDITDEGPERKPQNINRFRKSSISEPHVDDKKKPSGKRVRIQEKVEEEVIKKVKLSPRDDGKPPVIIEENNEPLPYEEQAAVEDVIDDEEEEEDYEEDEAEDKILSARQLLSQEVSAYDEEDEYFY